MENYPDRVCPNPVLKITQYPLPTKLIARLADECKSIMVMEEGYPVIEEQLRGLLNRCLTVKGRLDGSLPRVGELNANAVARALGNTKTQGEANANKVTTRPSL